MGALAVNRIETCLNGFTQVSVIAACVALVGLVAWLIGLIIVIRGSTPKDRPDILRAYAVCRPRSACRPPCYWRDDAPDHPRSSART